jgi:hypoxanthine phosphoribosyltransferase
MQRNIQAIRPNIKDGIHDVSWKEVTGGLENIIRWAARGPAIKAVYGIPRGGTILAVMFSHMLDGLEVVFDPHAYENGSGEGLLILDDIAETGFMMRRAAEALSESCRATLFKRATADADCYSAFIMHGGNNQWLVFPWENRDRAVEEYDRYHAKMRHLGSA